MGNNVNNKIKNLIKAKNIKKLVKSKLIYFSKTNIFFEIHFLIAKAQLAFTQLNLYLTK